MKRESIWQVIAILAIFLSPLACNMPGTNVVAPQTGDPTSAVQTFAAQLTQTAGAPAGPSVTPGGPTITSTGTPTMTATPTTTSTMTVTPTFTFTPTVTNTPTNTVNPTPCNAATFIADVTYPDDTEIMVNKTFVKTWRLKNVGTCTWTSGYQVIYASGDQMGAPSGASFTGGTVGPGSTADISVSLKAPGTEGTYQGYFKLKSSDGQIFGIGGNASGAFWVKIKAVAASSGIQLIPGIIKPGIFLIMKPDLKISSLVLNPNPAKMGVAVNVQVSVVNTGNTDASNFDVKFWGADTFPTPGCSWHVNTLAVGAGIHYNCNFTYGSWYGVTIYARATADTGGSVNELDETNNTLKIPVKVNP